MNFCSSKFINGTIPKEVGIVSQAITKITDTVYASPAQACTASNFAINFLQKRLVNQYLYKDGGYFWSKVNPVDIRHNNSVISGVKILIDKITTPYFGYISPQGKYPLLYNDKIFYTSAYLISEAIGLGGVGTDGKFACDFVFAEIGKTVELIPHGGPTYNGLLESETRRNKPKIKRKQYVPGGIYTTKNAKKFFLFIDSVRAPYITYATSRDDISNNSFYHKKYALGIDFRIGNLSNVDSFVDLIKTKNDFGSLNIVLVQQPNHVEQIGKIDIDPVFLTEKIKIKSAKEFLNSFAANHKKYPNGLYWREKCALTQASMLDAKAPTIGKLEISKFLTLV